MVAMSADADTNWLVPTPRHAAAVRAAFVVPIQQFADDLVRAYDTAAGPLTDPQRRLILDLAIAELRAGGKLDASSGSRGFAEAADGLIRELKQAGVGPKSFARVCGPELEPAAAVFAAFEKKRTRLGRLDPDDRLERAAVLWSTGLRYPFAPVRRVVVAGFVGFTEPEIRLLKSLAEGVDEFAVLLPEDERGEVFAGVRETVKRIETLRGDADLLAQRGVRRIERQHFPRPSIAGLAHLSRALFAYHPPAADASGLHLIEAPGVVGEARLVARAIRQLIATGAAPASIVVTARHPGRNADVLREVFNEYAVPAESPDPPRLSRHPGVAMLLRSWRLPDEDFPFAGVAALLRSTFFHPAWDTISDDLELPLWAESLLRQLGEPQGKDTFLASIETWCESPPVPLEDEHAEEPRRKRLHRQALRCRPFVQEFFRLWDDIPPAATPAGFLDRLKQFAGELGLSSDDGLTRFWQEVESWARNDWAAASSRKSVSKAGFDRMLGAIAAATPQPAAADGGGVRILAVEEARGADCDHLFIIDLGEGSFPDLSAPPSLLSDADRVRLRAAGLPMPDPEGRLADEMLLFVEIVSRPRKSLTLSYPAVDNKGQPLLPSSFLLAVGECFAPGAIPVTRQRMMIEGYTTWEPLSDAERRVHLALELAKTSRHDGWESGDAPVSPHLVENLRAARVAAAARFRGRDFGLFDGSLKAPAVLRDLAGRLGPAKVFSPTALEAYVACPFRFWVEHVLRLEPLDDPSEEVEHTRRGAAVHRALARFHARIRDHAAEWLAQAELPAAVDADLESHLKAAVEEDAARAGSPATKMLWQLEGKRLLRSLARYRHHWGEFRAPWREKGAAPAPHSLEADFGMPAAKCVPMADALVIQADGVEVRIGGRIDRVDVADLAGEVGFWVIDYKTGRGQHYTTASIERFERLQLPLYAVAVERAMFPGKTARPLGLAYWMVTAEGAKPVLPGKRKPLSWLADPAAWAKFRTQLESWVATLARHIRAGDYPLAPRSENCTDTCQFGPVCRIAQARSVGKEWKLRLPVAGDH
jgi:ATP-dependent helicase/DNAse subunit B